jgi:hypothetical protein
MRCKLSKISTTVLVAALGITLAMTNPATAQKSRHSGGGGVQSGAIKGGGSGVRFGAGPRPGGGAMQFGSGLRRGGGASTFHAGPRLGSGIHAGRRIGGARHFDRRGRHYGGGIYIWPSYPSYFYDEPIFFDDYVEIPEYYTERTVAYCIRRFKSYDLATRTYLGYDGKRHPCP